MPSCAKCDGFNERLTFPTPREYRDIARQLIETVEQGTFHLIEASCPLTDLFKDYFPGDIITHYFRCATCGREFHLVADTYHGDARWYSV